MEQLAFPTGASVYIDTQIIIYTIEANPTYFNLLQPLWQQFQIGDLEIITSELTLMETLVFPLRQGNLALVNDYQQLLENSEIQLIAVRRSILKDAANLRATTNLKTPDAIHAATALAENCTVFLSNDRAFRNVTNFGHKPSTVLLCASNVRGCISLSGTCKCSQ
ncbi:MAG: VapC toxin family PIN domain ribonuclease [Leptolyngbya sp. ERB_1_1]